MPRGMIDSLKLVRRLIVANPKPRQYEGLQGCLRISSLCKASSCTYQEATVEIAISLPMSTEQLVVAQ